MRARHVLLAALLLAAAPLHAARADDTRLTLSETATVMAPPDELAASLQAQDTAASPAEAQRKVNAAMADALARARQASGIAVSTGGYTVYRDTSAKPERWLASQTLLLHGTDGAALLTLVGALQQRGLAVSDLRWQLSDAAARRAQAEAMRQAIGTLRARADDAAGLLGLTFVRFNTVRLDEPHPVRPLMRMMAAMSAASALAPPKPAAK
jgi:predicted secreted protein